MRVLLDTHTFLWWSLEPSKLPVRVLELLKDSRTAVVISVVSAWEAQIKAGIGRLDISDSIESIVKRELSSNSWEVLQVSLSHIWKLVDLPPQHKDPFDRLLIAQALVEDLVIVGKDSVFSGYKNVKTLWG